MNIKLKMKNINLIIDSFGLKNEIFDRPKVSSKQHFFECFDFTPFATPSGFVDFIFFGLNFNVFFRHVPIDSSFYFFSIMIRWSYHVTSWFEILFILFIEEIMEVKLVLRYHSRISKKLFKLTVDIFNFQRILTALVSFWCRFSYLL